MGITQSLEWKGTERPILCLSELGYPLPPELGHWRLLVLRPLDSGTWNSDFWLPGLWPRTGSYAIGSLDLRSLALNWIIPPSFSVLQFADGRLRDFLASITMWANSYNKPPLICIYLPIYLYPIDPVSLENLDHHSGLNWSFSFLRSLIWACTPETGLTDQLQLLTWQLVGQQWAAPARTVRFSVYQPITPFWLPSGRQTH